MNEETVIQTYTQRPRTAETVQLTYDNVCDERCSKFKTEAEAEEVMEELIDRGILANIVESEVTARVLYELRS